MTRTKGGERESGVETVYTSERSVAAVGREREKLIRTLKACRDAGAATAKLADDHLARAEKAEAALHDEHERYVNQKARVKELEAELARHQDGERTAK